MFTWSTSKCGIGRVRSAGRRPSLTSLTITKRSEGGTTCTPASTRRFCPPVRSEPTDLVIGCVDTRAARAAIREATGSNSEVDYWLDLGNNADSGQFILGEPLNQVNRRRSTRLRSVAELYPAILDARLDDDGQPSCSAAEALDRQESFINQTLAQHALALLGRLFRHGTVSYHGGFVNLATGTCVSLRVDRKTWKRIQNRQRTEAARA